MSENTKPDSADINHSQTRTLKIAFLINAGMFALEFKVGLLIASTAILADSLDMLGDAMVYGFSLFVVSQSHYFKAIAAFVKGCVMALFGIFVLWQAIDKMVHPVVPHYETMGLVGLIALVANMLCFSLLWKHRGEDINMRSVWVCSRNDIIANIAVILAALGVGISGTQWPDLLAGLGIAGLFLISSFYIVKDAGTQLLKNTKVFTHY